MAEKIKKLIIPALYLMPYAVFADAGSQTGSKTDVEKVLEDILNLFGSIIPVIMIIATIVFLWGVAMYFVSADPEKRTEGRGLIIYGLIGLFVMVAVWGLVAIIQQFFDVGGEGILPGPGLQSSLTPLFLGGAYLSGKIKKRKH